MKANLDIFAETLLALAQHDRNVLVVTSDARGSGKLTGFGNALPDQLIEVGIAEQNLVGMAAGLAAAGKTVFVVSPACFLTARALEQIKNDVGYAKHPVKLVGISAGVSYGALGSTHHSLHDLAALQAIVGLDIVVPADNYETRHAVLAAAASSQPTYLRFGKRPLPDVHQPSDVFEPGKALTLNEGRDVTFLATGETVWRAVMAAKQLGLAGISAGVTSLPYLRPFDESAVLAAAHRCRTIVTVEEHSIHGGLGARCAALLLQAGAHNPFCIVGIPDEETVTGSQDDIFTHYAITPEGLAATAQTLLKQEG